MQRPWGKDKLRPCQEQRKGPVYLKFSELGEEEGEIRSQRQAGSSKGFRSLTRSSEFIPGEIRSHWRLFIIWLIGGDKQINQYDSSLKTETLSCSPLYLLGTWSVLITWWSHWCTELRKTICVHLALIFIYSEHFKGYTCFLFFILFLSFPRLEKYLVLHFPEIFVNEWMKQIWKLCRKVVTGQIDCILERTVTSRIYSN